MNHSNSLTTAALRRSRAEMQSYVLLAVGILAALVIPYLLQPHVRGVSTGPAVPISSR
jgi:hypothetical protein